jgi:tRNA A37 threonylcarbamoyladenosine dehydratase
MSKGIFDRSRLLLGDKMMEAMADKKVILFGIGGVGSWCAESLIRTGITNLTIVDSDRVCITNVNRQLMATTKTVGDVKTDALKARLLDINPNANIAAVQKIYNRETAEDFNLDDYDVVIDAIDSLSSKAHLIGKASESKALLFSSMGAALKGDPTRVRVDSFWNVKGCPLARKTRKMARKFGIDEKDFPCVYSDEVLPNTGQINTSSNAPIEEQVPGDPSLANHKWDDKKAAINGSLSHITGIFGLTLAGLVIQALKEEVN